MRTLLVALLVALAAAPPAGGTPPRVVAVLEDGAHDVTLTDHGALAVAFPHTDVRRATFTLADDDLVIELDVTDLAYRVPGAPEESYGFMLYTVPGPHVVIVADWYAGHGASYRLLVWPEPACPACGDPALHLLDGAWDLEASRVTVRVPVAHLPGDLRDLRMFSASSLSDAPVLGGLGVDLAPDRGTGIDVPIR